MLRRIGVALLMSATIGGCSDPRARELDAAQNAMFELAAQCRKDTEKVPAEHSMHCIEATKLVHPTYHAKDRSTSLVSHCERTESEACRQYELTMFHSQSLYWRAVAQSLAKFGAPEEPNGRADGADLYGFANLMEPYFAQCLKEYPDPPRLQKVKARPLQSDLPPAVDLQVPPRENRHCISLGGNKYQIMLE